MSWVCRSSELKDADWGLLEFEQSRSEAFIISKRNGEAQEHEAFTSNQDPASQSNLNSSSGKSIVQNADLVEWLTEVKDPSSQQDDISARIHLLMAGRTSSLEELPFTQQGFAKATSQLMVHGSIVRAINRNTSCSFSRFPHTWVCGDATIPSLVYNCRTAASWEDDRALSVTFFPDTLTSNAIWYGCDLSIHDIHGYDHTDAEIITSRLSKFDGGTFHPMLLPTIFADFERDRQIGLVRDCLTELVQRVHDLARQDTQSSKGSDAKIEQIGEKATRSQSRSFSLSYENLKYRLRRFVHLVASGAQQNISGTILSPHSSESSKKQDSSVLLWTRISFLRNGLKNWQAQLHKMIEHVDELDATDFSVGPAVKTTSWQTRVASLREAGDRIKGRLQDIVNEYDEFIRECTHIMDGMTLATQLELNNIGRKDAMTNQEISRVNLDVAKMARRDGSLMRSIATLGMVFLPATFVSTFFSMGFFQWAAEGSKGDQILSPYFWVYIVVTVALTILTILIFYSCALRQPRSDVENEKEIV